MSLLEKSTVLRMSEDFLITGWFNDTVDNRLFSVHGNSTIREEERSM